ncbi:MAG: hypothetical protein HKP59_04770 [Lutibacter sp.]|uniref:hypothetical protein n=1 Tax=Lutibacter sp. TaxID=1925666 RepID=UPI00181424E6|nr:hypothetical protein [Lutibacter sp.]MBT8316915.1 hypothetical protein [Lutibacter sp.]NNJ57775.1 hypothetical protein [Lutibacter sp.]
MNNSKVLLSILCLIVFFQIQAQESVYLETVEHGRGLLKSRSGECFVITPAHVVNESMSKISIIGNKNVLSGGNLVQELSSDLAIVRIVDGGTQNCTTWFVPKNYSSILNSTVDAYLELRENNGGSKLMQVFITEKDEETITIVPKRNTDSFVKGMSGGALFTQFEGKKIFLGMLQQMGDDGEGYVYQADDMERILGGFFEENRSNSSNITMSTNSVVASAISVEEEGYRFDLLSVKKLGTTVICKLRVTSLEKDGGLIAYGNYGDRSSKIYDQNGLETSASNVKLGSQSNASRVGFNYTLVKGIPVPLELTFKEIASDATGIAYLKIHVNDIDVKFKNISFNGMKSTIDIPSFENVNFSHQEEGFKFDLLSIKKSGTTVTCKLRITSLEKDGGLIAYGNYGDRSSKIYDQNGLETSASNVKLGSQSNASRVGFNYTLVKGIPVPLELTFKEIASNATGIAYLKIHINNFDVKFKNISFL